MIKKFLAIAFLILCCSAAFWLGTSSNKRKLLNEGLEVEPTKLNFGEVWENSNFHWELPLSNPTAQTIEMVGFGSSCGCVSIEPHSLTLGPGQKTKLRLKLDLRWPQDGKTSKNAAIRIVPKIQHAANEQAGWVLRGTVKRQFVLPAQQVYLGEVYRREAYALKPVIVETTKPIDKIFVTCNPEMAAVKALPVKNNERIWRISVHPNPELAPGNHTFEIQLNAQNVNGKLQGSGVLHVRVSIIEEVEIVPSEILCGFQQLGTKVKETIVLRCRTNRSFQVTNVVATSKETTVSQSGQEGTNGKIFWVTQKIAHRGAQKKEIVFHVQIAEDETVKLPLSIHYYGLTKSTNTRIKADE